MAELMGSRQRSEMMAGIKGQNAGLGLMVRQTADKPGLRFRLHRKELSSHPDLILPRCWLAVFVHGRLWPHRTDANLLNRSVATIDMLLP